MNSILLKVGKYLAIIWFMSIPLIWLVMGFNKLKNGGDVVDIIATIIHPIIIFLIIKIVFKQTYLKSYIFLGVVLFLERTSMGMIYDLIFDDINTSDLEEIPVKERFKYILEREKKVIFVLTILYLIVLSIGIGIISFLSKKNDKSKPVKKTERNQYSFYFDTSEGKVYMDNPFRGVYIQGGAGSGKGGSFFNPIITQAAEMNFSGVLYDFKSPELSKHAISEYRKMNKNIDLFFVDFNTPETSDRLNPIAPENLIKAAHSTEFSKAIIYNLLPETVKNNDFFGRSALSLLSGTIWFMKKRHPNKCTLPHIISLFLHTDIGVLLDNIKQEPEAYGMVASLKQAMDRGAEKQVAAVLSTLQNALAQLNTADIFWILSGDDLTLDLNNKENPKFLCVGNDSSLPEVYAPVISLIISVSSKIMNQPNKHHSIILLDEAPTIYIPKFEQIPATARSNKVAAVYGAQDYSQVVDCYEDNKAQVILSNLGNQFYGRTTNSKSTNMIKDLFSKEDKTYTTQSENDGSSGMYVHMNTSRGKGSSESIQERDRVKVSDITTMDTGDFYGIIAEGEPKEIIKRKFNYNPIKGGDIVIENKASEVEMDENYNRIVNESQNLFEEKEFKLDDF